MFFGEFEYRVDEKGRLPFPPRYRTHFRDGLVLAQGLEKSLTIYTMAEWKKLADTLTSSHLPPSKLRTLNRTLFAGATQEMLDGQGRISLPANLRDYAGLTDDVVIAGANTCLEIWDRQKWQTVKQAGQEQAWQIMESLEKH